MAWIGEETPCVVTSVCWPPLTLADGVRGKFLLSDGRVAGAGRDTSWVMGEGLQSELVSGERVEGEREVGPGVLFSVARGRGLGRAFVELRLLLLLLRVPWEMKTLLLLVEWWSGVNEVWGMLVEEERDDEPNE